MTGKQAEMPIPLATTMMCPYETAALKGERNGPCTQQGATQQGTTPGTHSSRDHLSPTESVRDNNSIVLEAITRQLKQLSGEVRRLSAMQNNGNTTVVVNQQVDSDDEDLVRVIECLERFHLNSDLHQKMELHDGLLRAVEPHQRRPLPGPAYCAAR